MRALAVLSLLAATAAVQAAPPAGRTYFTIVLGSDSPLSWEAECLHFTDTEWCTSDGTCGTWIRTHDEGAESAFVFEGSGTADGRQVLLEGRGRIDDRGAKSSLAAAVHLTTAGPTTNFGITGRSVPRRRCQRELRDFRNEPAMKVPSCYRRAHFPDAAESEYVLPFPAGESYRVSGGYCERGGHPNSIAYDFQMPVGADVVAVRAGTVVMVWEDTPDEPDEIRPNGLFIEHEDGTVGSYAHITYRGVLVDEGEEVEAGQVIAIGGTSGTSDPHLHFMVYQAYPTRVEDDDVPVSFRNADGPLDERGGLKSGFVYTARPD